MAPDTRKTTAVQFMLIMFGIFLCIIGFMAITLAEAMPDYMIGVGLIATACYLGIIARLAQARGQHRELLWMVDIQSGDDQIEAESV